jgi:hypothetical protein
MRDAAGEESSDPLLGSTTMADPVAFVTGWCLHDLGHPQEAADVLAGELNKIAAGASRTRSRYGARLALALAHSGEIDSACDVVQPLLADVEVVDSATVRHDLRRLRQTIGRWRTHSAVSRVLPGLAATLHTPQARG